MSGIYNLPEDIVELLRKHKFLDRASDKLKRMSDVEVKTIETKGTGGYSVTISGKGFYPIARSGIKQYDAEHDAFNALVSFV